MLPSKVKSFAEHGRSSKIMRELSKIMGSRSLAVLCAGVCRGMHSTGNSFDIFSAWCAHCAPIKTTTIDTNMMSLYRTILSLLCFVAMVHGSVPAPGTYPVCHICPLGQKITAPLAVITLGGKRFKCVELKAAGLLGSIRPALCDLIPLTKIRKTCGCMTSPVKTAVKSPIKSPVK